MKDKTYDIVTVSKRYGWVKGAIDQVNAQTIQPNKWIVIQEGHNAPPRREGTVSNLNASLNKGLRKVTAEYVIFYQDFIELPPDCFEKLLALASPDTFVTTCAPNADGTDDTRYLGMDGPRPCEPAEWETNVAIAPMGVMRELGGFDEEYDKGWSWDNVNIAERADMLGCKFIIDESNRPKLLFHVKEPDLNPDIPLNLERHEQTMADIRTGKRTLRNPYLNVG